MKETSVYKLLWILGTVLAILPCVGAMSTTNLRTVLCTRGLVMLAGV